MNKKCVCLICYTLNDIWVDFLSNFIQYDVYIIVDDNSKNYKNNDSKITNVNIIQICDEECKKSGFSHMNSLTLSKDVTGWDKAVYYFSTINIQYSKVWFFEDDVFFNHEKSLLDIDSQYDTSDLLSNSYGENKTGHKKDWLWNKIEIKFLPPYYCAMVCCVRMSCNLLHEIRNYANEYKTLFFLEALFPTICKKYNMKYETPNEFRNVVYRKDYIDKDIDKKNIFHPVKNITTHKYYRNILDK